MDIDEEYLGFRIHVVVQFELERLLLRAHVNIWPPYQDQDYCHFSEVLQWNVRRRFPGWPNNDDTASRMLAERAFHRARGAILLDRLDEIREQEFVVPLAQQFAARSDAYIQRLILLALDRVLRLQPGGMGHESFDDTGICLMEELDPSRVEYVVNRLQGNRLIEYFSKGDALGNRRFRATPDGLQLADKLWDETRAPSMLLEETVARVERILNKYKPDLVDSLRRQSLRVAEARELDEHEVGEIAQACEQIIWDFFDLEVLWEGIAGERPPKNNTRDRVRLLVRSRVPSETEQDLVEALEQYLTGWFGRVEQFIHKHRHLPGESERGHAKRFVVYTYLLLGDVMEVLGL